MLRFLVRRIFWMLFGLLMVSLVTFGLMQAAPGNFYDIMHLDPGSRQAASAQAKDEWERRYGLDQPVWRQYASYMWGLVRLDVGPSFMYPTRTVEEIIAQGFPTSAKLALMAVVVALLLGVPMGIIAALRRNTWIDYFVMFLSILGYGIPSYVAAVFLVLFFSLALGLLPTSGWGRPEHMIMPTLALALSPLASIARYVRSSLVSTLNQDYIRTAYAKGGRDRAVILGHALRNSLIPLVTVLGPLLGNLMVGSVLVENIFRVPGLGSYFAEAAGLRDFPLIISSTMFYAALIMVMNLLVDISYGILDPRIRYD